jgi:hypothetical protein
VNDYSFAYLDSGQIGKNKGGETVVGPSFNFTSSSANAVDGNIASNVEGFHFYQSDHNSVVADIAAGCSNTGFAFSNSSYNTIEHDQVNGGQGCTGFYDDQGSQNNVYYYDDAHAVGIGFEIGCSPPICPYYDRITNDVLAHDTANRNIIGFAMASAKGIIVADVTGIHDSGIGFNAGGSVTTSVLVVGGYFVDDGWGVYDTTSPPQTYIGVYCHSNTSGNSHPSLPIFVDNCP